MSNVANDVGICLKKKKKYLNTDKKSLSLTFILSIQLRVYMI